MINLTKIFPWLSIRNKLLIAFVGLSVLPVAFVGIYGIVSNVKMMEKIAFENLTHDVLTIREKTANFMANVESDLQVLQHSSLLQRFVLALERSLGRTSYDRELEQLSTELQAFAKTKGIYYQIRMVNETGDELLRIESDRPSDTTRSYRIVPASELRHGREMYYFLLVKNLNIGQIAIAPAELVYHETERIPVISFAMPVAGRKDRLGILIANVFAVDLFRVLEPPRHFNVDGKVVLVSGDGHYLFHSEKKSAWNKLLASKEEDNLQHDYPALAARNFISGHEGTVAVGDEIVSFGPLFPTVRSAAGAEVSSGLTVPLFVFESVPKDTIMGPVHSIALT
ncbi:MAG: cache domain-containing protein, partial [Bacteroidota bacterium]